ncbi:uncharacterized protein E0L32_012388 [Thyridium curvatum]|uniref:NADP-dependent oxidoreductase domain-containing protein n=1 Tax=Thyridium curvatum TaxID=1093900 RepID=A0A507BDK7_9PEZI|nr:uncharacterized protein E0L32_012388 [Thyridium curvatum]TPX16784.1 hypothetical protein E0L32_012388 [Thyridium curvatum]
MGFLNFTWRPEITPDEQAFACMKAAIAGGATRWSTAYAYGPPDNPGAGLQLLGRYFAQHPEDAAKVTLFVRGCIAGAPPLLRPATSRAEVLASAAECAALLGPNKRMDIFGPARMDDGNVPVEETAAALRELVGRGEVGAAGLSEVSAETIRRACAVVPIAAVEEELSLWSTEILTNGVAEVCRENGVEIWAYAPLGYGFLTGQIRRFEDIPEGDLRRMLGRFRGENFNKNLDLVDKVEEFAARKGVKPAQLALAWVRAHSEVGNCGTIIPIPGTTSPAKVEENCRPVPLSAEEKAELDKILASISVVGHRSVPEMPEIC